MTDFHTPFTLVRARKRHVCDYCGERIQKGELHQRQFAVYEGCARTWREHTECKDAIDRLVSIEPDGVEYLRPRDNPRGLTEEEYEDLPEREESA